MTISAIIAGLNEAAEYHAAEAAEWEASADLEGSKWDAETAAEHRARTSSLLAAIEQLHRLEGLEK